MTEALPFAYAAPFAFAADGAGAPFLPAFGRSGAFPPFFLTFVAAERNIACGAICRGLREAFAAAVATAFLLAAFVAIAYLPTAARAVFVFGFFCAILRDADFTAFTMC